MIPDSIQALIDAILDEVQRDSGHQMKSARRGELYQAFAQAGDAPLRATPAWQAILAAQRVLPTFEQGFPNDPAPREILDTAIALLQGKADQDQVQQIIDRGYHASGNAWGYDEMDITWPQWLAANSAYRALVEAQGYRPLDKLPRYVRNGVQIGWIDRKLSELAGDAAAAAAMASASDDRGVSVDPDRLLAFWEWWLTDAIDEAVIAARDGRLPR